MKKFFSILFGREIPAKTLEEQRVIIDEEGNISINYGNPNVLRNIEDRMKKFENIPLSKDIKQAAQS